MISPEMLNAVLGVIASVVLAGGALLGEVLRRKLNAMREHAEATREQVQNSHTTNLRDDIDKVLAAQTTAAEVQTEILATLRAHSTELEGIRADLRQERVERVAGDQARTVATVAAAVASKS